MQFQIYNINVFIEEKVFKTQKSKLQCLVDIHMK